ncbi:MAG: hypothetical protein ACTSVF_03205 [Candidatus Asgardarchaeia archaeon]
MLKIPKDEEYLVMDILYRLLLYFREMNVKFDINDLVMFTRTFFSGFDWERHFAKIMNRAGFLLIKLSTQNPPSRIIERKDIFDYILLMGNKRFGVECKSRHDPLLIGSRRLKSQLWLSKALRLDDLLIAWRTGTFWFLVSSRMLKEKAVNSLGISEDEVISEIERTIMENPPIGSQKYDFNGNIVMGGIYAEEASKTLTFSELLSRHRSLPIRKKGCIVCGKPTYYTCKICGSPVCLDHAVLCEIEAEVYCKNCAKNKRCKVCGRMGCNFCVNEKGICTECLME